MPEASNKRWLILLIIIILTGIPILGTTAGHSQPVSAPHIHTLIEQVDAATVVAYNAQLSGELPIEAGGEPYTLTTRYTGSGLPIQNAVQFVGQHFTDLGLEVTFHSWQANNFAGTSVIGELSGQAYPDQVFIIGAHLDSTSNFSPNLTAPGADDNASGSVGVLIAADILSQLAWDYTLRFALWTGEEQGLLGSIAYANEAQRNGENILGVLNLDMIGYNSDANLSVDLYARSALPGSITMAHIFSQMVERHDLTLDPEILVDNWLGNYSDNRAFWDMGYPAILVIEDVDDFNPYYHTIQDELDKLDSDYFTEVVKAAVATFAFLADNGLNGYQTFLPFVR